MPVLFDSPKEERNIESYLSEARAMVGKWGPKWMLKDDWCLGNIASAIAKAEYSYDPSRGVKRSTLRITYGRNQMFAELRSRGKWKNRPTHFSISAPFDQGDEKKTDLEDYREPSYVEVSRKEELEEIKFLVKKIIAGDKEMTKKQRQYIKMRYIKGLTVTEISKRRGCSKQAVHQVLGHAIAKLKVSAPKYLEKLNHPHIVDIGI